MKDSLKEDNPNYHYVIEYSDLNGEIGMTSDVDKMNDKDDIIWNKNNQGDSMEQILHVVEPQCVADVLFSHSDEQWKVGTYGILEDNWRIQKENKDPHCPEVYYWKKYIRLVDEEMTVDSRHYSGDYLFAEDGHRTQMCQVMFFHLNSSQVSVPTPPIMHHHCC